jgi:hypothetical protein
MAVSRPSRDALSIGAEGVESFIAALRSKRDSAADEVADCADAS